MLSDITILFLIAHVAADYYLQSPALSIKKETEGRALALHLLIYAAVMLLCALPFGLLGGRWAPMPAAFSIAALHAAADIVKFYLSKSKRAQSPNAQARVYIVDQLFHIICVVLVMGNVSAAPSMPGEILRWVLLLALIHKPANVSFKKLLSKYDAVEDTGKPDTLPGAGAVIGSLERALCAIFIGLGQYASIGLIYTAKSIARFKKIEENPRFAEYYLIGTLYSILFVVVSYLLVIKTL